MKIKTILIPAISGTTLMSIFSYIVSHSKSENFKEPKLLAEIVKRAFYAHKDKLPKTTGWAMHYAMGVVMTMVFQHCWKETNTIPASKDGMVAGIIGGLAGVMIWKVLFRVHPNPPRIPFMRFAGHLLLAHIVFTLGVAYCSSLFEPFQHYKREGIKPNDEK